MEQARKLAIALALVRYQVGLRRRRPDSKVISLVGIQMYADAISVSFEELKERFFDVIDQDNDITWKQKTAWKILVVQAKRKHCKKEMEEPDFVQKLSEHSRILFDDLNLFIDELKQADAVPV